MILDLDIGNTLSKWRLKDSESSEIRSRGAVWTREEWRPGADIPDTLARAKAAIEARCALHFKLDHDINRSDLIAAGSVVGVQKLELLQPAIDLVTNASTARRCTAVTLNHAGVAL